VQPVKRQKHQLLFDAVAAALSASESLSDSSRPEQPPPDQVLEQLRRESQVPVIVLTGLCDTEAVTRMIEMGANDYVIKPFKDRELMTRVRAKIEHPQISKN
jgi:response regulator RpfG family c-di-GMP phosphodiesterase